MLPGAGRAILRGALSTVHPYRTVGKYYTFLMVGDVKRHFGLGQGFRIVKT